MILLTTSFVSIGGRLFYFATSLAGAARVFTVAQLSGHPELSGRGSPDKRAREFLSLHRDTFEHIHGIYPHLHLWRLTAAYKRKSGLKYRSVSASQHTSHWLMIGDVWMHLTLNGLRPEKWFTEGKAIGGFDVFCMIGEQPYLMEVQRSELTQREWQQKWHRRVEWLKLRRWREPASTELRMRSAD